MTTDSQTPRTAWAKQQCAARLNDLTWASRGTNGIGCLIDVARDCEEHVTSLELENARLREALVVALPLMDAWLNGDGTNIDMNEWDAVVMIARAALVQS